MLSKLTDAAASSAAAAERPYVGRKSFLSTIRIDHGPSELLSRVFIAADAAFSDLGLDLVFAGFDDVEQVNHENRASWKPLNPTFVPANGLVDADRAFALFGVDRNGVVVSVIGGILFDWSGTTLRDEAASLRFLYKDPTVMAPAHATCEIQSPSGAQIQGRAAYSGAHWIHPNLRKRNLASVNARLLRAVAYARWGMDIVFGITSLGLIGKGHSERNGWAHIEPGVAFGNLDSCPPQAGLVWMTADEVRADLAVFLGEIAGSGDEAVQLRRAENAAATVDLDRQDQAGIANRGSAA